MVRDHLPLQQGLRPRTPALQMLLRQGQRPSSITTRIKTWPVSTDSPRRTVRDHLPLQQGLRLAAARAAASAVVVRDHLPLQQGLRLYILASSTSACRQRPSSITTRIKTVSFNAATVRHWSETIFTENLLRHDNAQASLALFIWLKRRFPLQQGLRLYVSITEEVVESVRDHFHRESPTPWQCSSELGIVHLAKRRFSPRNSYAMEILEQVLNFSSGLNGIFHYNKD